MRHVLRCSLSLIALAACTADEEPVESPTRLIAAVDRPSGNRVEFHATDDGELLLSESGPNDNLPTLAPGLAVEIDPRDYYRALTGTEPPDELAALVVDGDYRRVDPRRLALTDGPRPASPWYSASWFRDAACDKYPGADKEWCVLNRSTDSSQSEDDVNGVYAVVSVDRGEVDMQRRTRPWWDWSTSTWTVEAGHWHSWWKSKFSDFDFQSRIREADGDDLYHHAGMACWDAGSCPVFAPLD